MSQKSYDNTPTLYIVPTPIGNLDDITIRAINILKSVDVIFSEDTRITLNLLNHFEIKKHLVSMYKFNENESSYKMLEYLKNGKNVALVSDRGTPILSDPGNISTKKVIDQGFNVVSLPGATAAIPALTSSGLDASKFLFYGFLSHKKNKRIDELNLIKSLKYTIIFYEAPHRIIEMLNDLLFIFGNRKISISREISKKYEEIYRGFLVDVINELDVTKGEFVIVVEGKDEVVDISNLSSIKEEYDDYIKIGINEKDAIKKIAKNRKIPKNEVYREIKIFPGK